MSDTWDFVWLVENVHGNSMLR